MVQFKGKLTPTPGGGGGCLVPVPRDVATMHAWIVNAPSLKPGVQMPALSQLTGGQLHDLVAYLEELQ